MTKRTRKKGRYFGTNEHKPSYTTYRQHHINRRNERNKAASKITSTLLPERGQISLAESQARALEIQAESAEDEDQTRLIKEATKIRRLDRAKQLKIESIADAVRRGDLNILGDKERQLVDRVMTSGNRS